MKRFFSAHPIWKEPAISLLRILAGLFMVYHGLEVFQPDKMKGYTQWLTDLHTPGPQVLAYIGKGIEFFAGVLFTIGLFTRLMTIPLLLTMAFVAFIMGHGKIFTDDQHPFLFVFIFLLFFFVGAGKWSADYLLFDRKN